VLLLLLLLSGNLLFCYKFSHLYFGWFSLVASVLRFT